MADRDTYKYILKDGNEIVDYGITNDLERREQEHRNCSVKSVIAASQSLCNFAARPFAR